MRHISASVLSGKIRNVEIQAMGSGTMEKRAMMEI
jgi:hypothetical protein